MLSGILLLVASADEAKLIGGGLHNHDGSLPDGKWRMPRFKQTSEILELMAKKDSIRNVGIIAHIDHGKTTLTDSLLAEAGLLSPKIAGTARALDYLEEEQKRGITLKTANISLLHEKQGAHYLINLIDTPGHVDFTGKVTRALRAIDGAVVVVDAVEEVMVQTETVTRQALSERVKPVLFINKIDRLVKELKLSSRDIQAKLARIIRDFNSLIDLHGNPEQRKTWKVDPAEGTVAFGSALHRWGFTMDMAQERGLRFSDVISAYRGNDVRELEGTVPVHESILAMVTQHHPNPVEAQQYRVPGIWKGRIDSEIGKAMLAADPAGPTTMCLTMVQMDPHAGLIVTGRLFSGSVQEGEHVYLVGAKRDCRIQQVSMYMGAFREIVDVIGSGNIAALLGLEQARAGETLVAEAYRDAMAPFERVRYVSEPVITVAIEPRHPKNLPRLLDVLERLAIEDPNLLTSVNKETGEYLVSGIGELHLEIAVKTLEDYAGKDLEIVTSKPLVVYRESVSSQGSAVMAKSPNKHNSLRVQVEPLADEVVQLMETGDLSEDTSRRQVEEALKKAGWSAEEAGNVWMFEEHKNVLVNLARGVEYLDEARELILSGFRWACKAGPLCEEPIRGVKVKLMDVSLHESPLYRGPAQIVPATRRGLFGAFLSSKPVILEPVFKVGVTVSAQWLGEVSSLIAKKRGRVTSSEPRGYLTMLTAFVPVAETFGLSAELRSATSGHAFWQSVFDHWERVSENVAASIIRTARGRRGLPPDAPHAGVYVDAS
jgi:elongation factor 2